MYTLSNLLGSIISYFLLEYVVSPMKYMIFDSQEVQRGIGPTIGPPVSLMP